MAHTNNLTDYHNMKLAVRSIAQGSLSFTLSCYCQTSAVPKSIEPCPVLVNVNFYKFKAWIIDRDWILNFENWLFKHRHTAYFYECLSEYINYLQGRNLIYVPPTQTSAKLDSLIAQAKEVTAIYQSLV